MGRSSLFCFYIFWIAGLPTGSHSGDASNGELKAVLIDLDTRPGVKQKFIFIQPPQPVASVILFAGGHGNLGLNGAHSMDWGRSNFLVRTRSLFARRALAVAVVDAPSDRKTSSGMHGFRSSPEHLADIEAVVAFLRQQANAPVWLVGTSRGTLSAAHIANQSDSTIDGLILTSSMYQLTSGSLSKINIPTLMTAHNHDQCHATPPGAAKTIAKLLLNSPKVEVIYFNGGWLPESGPCNAKSQHGFYGIESKVIAAMIDFIQAHSPKTTEKK